ncbi:unnamed protein product [Oncorhynchus mykiss]|uniref:Phosphoinositide phospholipase C n=1 Tax=Oncorhynchus mykiss TaxID=8022 RepID=A0A060XPQ3_ONCMY|nr:unnamed protein product [Oncorhynchus mykiss]
MERELITVVRYPGDATEKHTTQDLLKSSKTAPALGICASPNYIPLTFSYQSREPQTENYNEDGIGTCIMLGRSKKPPTAVHHEPKAVESQPKTQDPLRKLGVLDDENVRAMMHGSNMVKVRSQRWQKSRSLRLLEDGVTVWCESTKSSRKAKAQQTFSVTEVECVREGCQSEALRRLSGSVPENQCFTVVFRGGRKSLDLLCPCEEEARRWASAVRFYTGRFSMLPWLLSLTPHTWICGYLRRADENDDGKMSYDEVKRLLQMINIDLNEQYARSLFKKADRSCDGRLDHVEIEEFCRDLMRRPELDAVFRHYSGNGCVLSTAELRDFLGDQGEDASLIHAQSLIRTYELNDWAQNNQFMTQNGFTVYMLSQENDVFNPDHARVHQDMTRPLAHYFISSSHNTYLTKDQVTSASSAEPYIRALNQGCRCVELDCWDGDKGEPVIYHGHTLTSKVPFKEVIETIAQYAFKASPYPLILSLENHCTVEQQTVMARHLRTILGKRLLTKPLKDHPLKDLPSPEVRHTPLSPALYSSLSPALYSPLWYRWLIYLTLSSLEVPGDGKLFYIGPPLRALQMLGICLLFLTSVVIITNLTLCCLVKCVLLFTPVSGSLLTPVSGSLLTPVPGSLLTPVPGSLLTGVNYRTHFTRLQSVSCCLFSHPCLSSLSLSAVALNFQTPGEQMDLNQGRFLPNGRCGYVLKPSFLCSPSSSFNPEITGGGPGHIPTQLTIRILSAQQLPKINTDKPNSIVDPQVWVEIHGVAIDNSRDKTHRIDNNGFNPRWDSTLSFQLQVPELALVRFVVEDHDHKAKNDFVGQYTLPFTSLRTGYRHVHLLKADGSSLSPSTLFIHVKVSGKGVPIKTVSERMALAKSKGKA